MFDGRAGKEMRMLIEMREMSANRNPSKPLDLKNKMFVL